MPSSDDATNDKNDKDSGEGYSMIIIYSVLIVLLLIVLIWSSMGDEKFLPKQVRSDVKGDWDIISELAKLQNMQEQILRKSLAMRN